MHKLTFLLTEIELLLQRNAEVVQLHKATLQRGLGLGKRVTIFKIRSQENIKQQNVRIHSEASWCWKANVIVTCKCCLVLPYEPRFWVSLNWIKWCSVAWFLLMLAQRSRSHPVLSLGCPAACDFPAEGFHGENSLYNLARGTAPGHVSFLAPSWAISNKTCFSTLGRTSVRLRLVEVWVSLCTPFPAPTCRRCQSSQKMLTTRRTWHGWFSHHWTKPPLWTSLSPSLPRRGKPLSYQVSAFVPLLFAKKLPGVLV